MNEICKRIISLVLAMILVIGWIPAQSVHAEESDTLAPGEKTVEPAERSGASSGKEGGFSYLITDGEATILDYDTSAGKDAVIPETLGGCPVTGIGEDAFGGILSVTIPDSIRFMEVDAFYYCITLERVYISDLTAWLQISFGDRESNPLAYAKELYIQGQHITDLVIPEGISAIGPYAFHNFTGLTSITFSDDIQYVDATAFTRFGAMEKIVYQGAIAQWETVAAGMNPGVALVSVICDDGTVVAQSVSGTCGQNLTWILTPEGTLTIRGTGAMNYYDRDMGAGASPLPYVTTPWYDYGSCDFVRNIVLEEGVTQIDSQMTYLCEYLESVTIPVSLKQFWLSLNYLEKTPVIYYRGTQDQWEQVNHGLYGTDIPVYDLSGTPLEKCVTGNAGENITWKLDSQGNLTISGTGSMGDYTWQYYSEFICTVMIGEGITSISDSAFERCNKITSVTIPDSVAVIGSHAFRTCTSLKSVTIPAGVERIEGYAFYSCSSLTEIAIPEGVTFIGAGAFSGCARLEKAIIPASVTELAVNAFGSCKKLSELTISKENSFYEVDETGAVRQKETGALVLLPGGYRGVYRIPSDVTAILPSAFYGCTGLTEVTIPKGITAIPGSAFRNCTGLGKIILPDGITLIDEYAFSGCTGMSSVSMPNSITEIGSYAFEECVALGSVVLPNGIKSIKNRTFSGCIGLSSISIPATVTAVGSGVFSKCDSLVNVYFQGTQEQWDTLVTKTESLIGYNPFSKATVHILPKNLYWNVDRQKAAEGGTARTPDKDGYYYVQLAVNGQIKSFKTRSKKAIDYIDNSNGATALYLTTPDGMEFTEARSAIYADGVEAAGPINLRVTSVEGNTIGLEGKDATIMRTLAENCQIYDVSGKSAFIGARTELLVGDTFRSYVDDQEQLVCIYILTREQTPEQEQPEEEGPNGVCAAADRMQYLFSLSGGGDVVAECPVCKSQETWKTLPVPSGSTAIESGHYYLSENQNITGGYYSIKDNVEICLNLNGKYLTNATERVFFVDSGAKLNIMGSGVVSGGRSATTAAERCGSALEIVGSTGTVVNLFGGTFRKTRADLDTVGIRGRINSTLNIYDGTVIDSTQGIGGNGLWTAGGTVNIRGGKILGDVYVRTYTDGVTSAARPVTVTFAGGEVTGKVLLDNSKGSQIQVILDEKPVIRELVMDSTLLLDVWELEDGAAVGITGEGVFTKKFEDAQDYCKYFTAVNERKEVRTEGNALSVVGKTISGSCGENVIWQLDPQNRLTISGTGDMETYNFYNDYAPWYNYREVIEEVQILQGVTSIGSYAFEDCYRLKFVDIAEGVTSIGGSAFDTCIGLTTVSIPEGVTEINNSAFWGCSALTTIHIPDSVKYFGAYAFNGCKSLAAIHIPDGVTALYDGVFWNCNILTDVSIPDTVTFIDRCAFYQCFRLSQINIPVGVTKINADAFSYCTDLKDVYYGGSEDLWARIEILNGDKEEFLDGTTIHYMNMAAKKQTGHSYATLAEAIAAAEEGERLTLCRDISENVTLDKDLCLDLNGFSITGTVTVADGVTLYGMDSQTDDFSVADGVYGRLKSVSCQGSGTVAGLPQESQLAQDGYLAVTEEGGISFHRVSLRITAMTLRASEVGVYYESIFEADEVAAGEVISYGVVLSVVPDAAWEQCGYSAYRDFCSGASVTGTLLRGIMKEENSLADNCQNAEMPIYGRAYIETEAGYFFSSGISQSFRQLMERIDGNWSRLNEYQKESVRQLVCKYEDVIKSMGWYIPEIQNDIR